ncbi:PREDICTED: cytoplasmic dynein 1 light intermediate chain 2-like [Amphimedon queenslandica]|uniref:Dynein light intermediate chain n=1 Tax=Amphimedon queenslandica TaxID=400682 RepID=A0A1X7TSJ1_AMPQE|nr:PREDICTED: cytoplasmic dynein 1 light intermediate chain 2-like [Amphimedon queenslandica]|eukprot:XP_019858002.1 PREDICTED: cytoplasmic dynein 1 light intermediate chain 2-like [Amphimedon queenslandica]
MAAPNHTTTEEEGEENVSLWSEVLEDVIGSSNKTVKAASKNVLVLGEVCSGKSTLIDRLCSVSRRGGKRSSSSHNKKYLLSGCSLEYRPVDVYDDETDGK